jgi:hypothetical protein
MGRSVQTSRPHSSNQCMGEQQEVKMGSYFFTVHMTDLIRPQDYLDTFLTGQVSIDLTTRRNQKKGSHFFA